MRCVAVSPWGDACVLDAGHAWSHMTEQQRTAARVAWEAEREAFWAQCAAKAAARRLPAPPPPAPIALVPTAAQRAAGVRIVDARDDQMPAAARRLRDAVAAAGHLVRVTYAHALMPPKRGGDDWWDNHTVAVRVARADGQRGWGVWSNGKWDGGQWWVPGTIARGVGSREFAALAAASVVLDPSLDSQVLALVGSSA